VERGMVVQENGWCKEMVHKEDWLEKGNAR
jgi:hypothetical protein